MEKKRVAILGAGFTGLTTAYKLTQEKEFSVTLIEKQSLPGGLAAGFKKPDWEWSLENAYHHLFTSDNFAQSLTHELKIPVIFKRPITATYIHEKITQLDSPISLIRYPYLSLLEKVRTGLTLAYLRYTPFWLPLEKVTAKKWLTKFQGVKPWQELWEPLFIGKFGKYANQVAASWFWARIKKRSARLGYIEGGFQRLAERLNEQIEKQQGKVLYNTEVVGAKYNQGSWDMKIKKGNSKPAIIKSDFVVSTLPMPIFLKVFPALPRKYCQKMTSIPHLHALNLILELNKPFFTPISRKRYPYWLNINDSTFPFLAVVEHTNFMDKKHYGRNHLLYIGNYLPREHKFFKMKKGELLKLFAPFLKKINPCFDPDSDLVGVELSVAPFAQPVILTNYSKIKPALTTSLPKLFVGNLDSVYPWDRGINYAIELGERLTDLVKYAKI